MKRLIGREKKRMLVRLKKHKRERDRERLEQDSFELERKSNSTIHFIIGLTDQDLT